ncbi:helix-turn-helix transcriptional regulator [Vibrio aestuarianus]|uniref:helix-turn-helix transcriptional regulator n=1 Tax=Vibrio aestuarianus TaxID=28171 RepID=UPI00237C691A|nr:AlpA family phage regulatory protein [Vibrio aestuarianus]
MTDIKVLRLNEVTEMLGVSKSTIYNWIKQGEFPPGLLIGPKSRGWLSQDIEHWLIERSEH